MYKFDNIQEPDYKIAVPDASIYGIIRTENIKEKLTFHKAIMVIIMILYFMGAVLGAVMVLWSAIADVSNGRPIDSAMFIAFAAYIGGPVGTAIGFYSWKSKAENLVKIQNSFKKSQTLAETLANMKGE